MRSRRRPDSVRVPPLRDRGRRTLENGPNFVGDGLVDVAALDPNRGDRRDATARGWVRALEQAASTENALGGSPRRLARRRLVPRARLRHERPPDPGRLGPVVRTHPRGTGERGGRAPVESDHFTSERLIAPPHSNDVAGERRGHREPQADAHHAYHPASGSEGRDLRQPGLDASMSAAIPLFPAGGALSLSLVARVLPQLGAKLLDELPSSR
jgi:hypothetical protein